MKHLGHGSFGEVIEAQVRNADNITKNKIVAIKILKKKLNTGSIESQIYADLLKNHNIKGLSKVYEIDEIENRRPYYVMERLGFSLKDIIEKNRGKFSLSQIVGLGL